MKFKIIREDLLTPLQHVIGAVEKKQTLPTLNNFLIKLSAEQISVTATDLEIEMVSVVDQVMDETGEITLPARKLLDICKALPSESMLSFNVDNDKALIQSGRSRFTLTTLPASDFPSLDEVSSVHEFTIPQKILKSLIEKTAFSMAQQDVRYYLNGLMLEVGGGILRAVATDGHRLAYCEKTIDDNLIDSKQVIVPRKGIGELMRLLADSDEPVKVILGNNHIQCEFANQRFTSKLIDGRFPDYNRVIPAQEGNVIIIEREVLKQALTRTSILSNEKYRGIRIILSENLLRLQAQNPDQEEADVEVEIDYNGNELEVGFNVNYMLEVLNTTNSDIAQLIIKDANSSCLMLFPDNSECKYVIMPMRL